MTNERWLKWAVARYYRSLGYKVSMKPARVGNAMVDGVALSPDGERIAIEVKSPRDDIIRGVGQCSEALAAGYSRAVLVTTLRVAKKLRKHVFQRRGLKLRECETDEGPADYVLFHNGVSWQVYGGLQQSGR